MPSTSSHSHRRPRVRAAGQERRPDRDLPRRQARAGVPQLRIKRTTYDYAGQDPINEYDLDGNCSGFWNYVHAVKHAIGHGAKTAGHGIASAWRTIRPKDSKDFFIGIWEGTDTLIIGGLTVGTAEICGAALIPSGGLDLIGCIPALGAEGLGTYLSGKATVRDFENAYRHRRKHRLNRW